MAKTFTELYKQEQQLNEGMNQTETTSFGSTSVDADVDTGVIDDLAMSPTGDLDLQRYLLESGLQDAFNMYQTQVANLEVEQRQSLQDAYRIRELSKKYLGEYASNVGMGDVSGNLLDIYSNYAQNIGEIQGRFADLEAGLQQTFLETKMKETAKILETEFNIQVAELDALAADAMNFVFDNYGTDIQAGLLYIDSQQSVLRPQDYEALKRSYYKANADEVIANLSNPQAFFGFSDPESGTAKTAEQYLEEAKAWLSEEDYNMARGMLAVRKQMEENQGSIEMPELVGSFIDPTMYTDDPGITSDSKIFELELDGGIKVRYAESTLALGVDPEMQEDYIAGDKGITSEVLNKYYEDNFGPIADIQVNQVIYNQGYYRYTQNGWRRLIPMGTGADNFDRFTKEDYATWNEQTLKETDGVSAGGVVINFDVGEQGYDSITYNGRTYLEDNSIGDYKDEFNNPDIDIAGLIKYLNETFEPDDWEGSRRGNEVADYVMEGQIFFYQGKFYVYTADGKKIRPMKLQTEGE